MVGAQVEGLLQEVGEGLEDLAVIFGAAKVLDDMYFAGVLFTTPGGKAELVVLKLQFAAIGDA